MSVHERCIELQTEKGDWNKTLMKKMGFGASGVTKHQFPHENIFGSFLNFNQHSLIK